MPHIIAKAGKKKRVVVVGAGPAGLEAARVSAERGHDVVLFERSGRTGGQVNIAARATWRESLSGIVRWLDLQAKKLKVDLRLNTEATADAVLGRESATSSSSRPAASRTKAPSTGADYAVTTRDILLGKVAPGRKRPGL